MKSFIPVNVLSLSLSAILFGSLALSGCSPSSDNAKTQGSSQSEEGSSQSSSTEDGALASVQKIVDKSSSGQFKASKLFDGPEGMTGVLVEPTSGGANKLVAWTNDTGTILMPGPLFDKDGVNLTETYLNNQAGYTSPEKLAEQVLDRGFLAGKSGPIVTVFFEPYCGYCNALFEKMEPLFKKGDIRARFIMVAFLRPDSAARAADIENAKDPFKALSKWEHLEDKSKAKESTATQEQQDEIIKNNNLMNAAGQSGTPALLSCNKNTKQIDMNKGMPVDFEGFISNVGSEGSPACN